MWTGVCMGQVGPRAHEGRSVWDALPPMLGMRVCVGQSGFRAHEARSVWGAFAAQVWNVSAYEA